MICVDAKTKLKDMSLSKQDHLFSEITKTFVSAHVPSVVELPQRTG